MANPFLSSPESTVETDWRIPRQSDRIDRVLMRVPKNGDWHVIRRGAGFTVSEQQARALNVGGGSWEFGYRVYASNGELVSDLAVRWVGAK